VKIFGLKGKKKIGEIIDGHWWEVALMNGAFMHLAGQHAKLPWALPN